MPLSPELRLAGLWRTDRFSLRFCNPHPNYLWKLVVQFQESVTDTICEIIPGFYTPDHGHTHTHTQTHMYSVYLYVLYACIYVYAYKHTYLYDGCFMKLITLLLISFLSILYLSISVVITQGAEFHDYALFLF